jgi:hypothetical protein
MQIQPSKAMSTYRKLKYAEDLIISGILVPLECIQFTRTVVRVRHDQSGKLVRLSAGSGGSYDVNYNLVLRQMVPDGELGWRTWGEPLRVKSLKVGCKELWYGRDCVISEFLITVLS